MQNKRIVGLGLILVMLGAAANAAISRADQKHMQRPSSTGILAAVDKFAAAVPDEGEMYVPPMDRPGSK